MLKLEVSRSLTQNQWETWILLINSLFSGDDDQSDMEAAGNEDAGSGEEGGEEVEAEEE